jgi:hypothetical protein
MQMNKLIATTAAAALLLAAALVACGGAEQVADDGTPPHIIDRTGEKWPLNQAVKLGFEPGGFEFGLGRHAFTPLDDSRVKENPKGVPDDLRVIGVVMHGMARAYSVKSLSRHEVANSEIGGTAFAVAY